MPVYAPPAPLAYQVNSWAPGIYSQFITRIIYAGLPRDTIVTSWWRSPERNREVGGADSSQHLLGLGMDLVSQEGPGDLLRALRRTGLIVVPERTHVHVQAWPAGLAARVGLLQAVGLA